MRVWQCRSEWAPSGRVASYLYRITRNLALNSLRNRQALRRRERHNVEETIRPWSGAGLRHSRYESIRAEVEAEVAKLSAKRREVFLLARFYGLSHHEIAETMEISVSTVANHMTSALSQLRKALSHHLVE
jgi:RNA polymerase sigma-70 factor (ECF subfamily)